MCVFALAPWPLCLNDTFLPWFASPESLGLEQAEATWCRIRVKLRRSNEQRAQQLGPPVVPFLAPFLGEGSPT